jgi:MYXO-CTERM domain-containing protein
MGTILGKQRELTFWATVAGLLPLAYASSFVAIGPTTAEGCSGGPGEDRVGITDLSAAKGGTKVGRDGFFPFRATAANIDRQAALDLVTVEVRDENGDLVPGDTVFIADEGSDEYGTDLLLGWSATGTTPSEGEELAFHVTATNSLDGVTPEEVTFDERLIVVDVAPELTLPSFDVTGWTRVKYDDGTPLDCYNDDGDCDSSPVGSELRDAHRMTLDAVGVDEPVLVLWEYDWVAVAGKGTLVRHPSSFVPQHSEYGEELWFAAGLDEYCVRLRGTDLRTGDTKEAEICASPSSDSSEVIYDSIWECSEPPEGYLERWCRAVDRVGDSLGDHAEECEPYLNPTAGAGGTSGEEPGSGGAPDPGPGGTGSAGKGGGSTGGAKGGAANGGTTGGTEPEPAADAGAPPPDGSGGSAGAVTDDETPETGSGDSHTVLTKGGCGCRTAASGTARDSALAGAGLLAFALGLGLRRRRRERERDAG